MSLKNLALTATALVALGALLPLAPAAAADIIVAVTAIVEHPSLDACRDGVKEELAAQGFEDGKTSRSSTRAPRAIQAPRRRSRRSSSARTRP